MCTSQAYEGKKRLNTDDYLWQGKLQYLVMRKEVVISIETTLGCSSHDKCMSLACDNCSVATATVQRHGSDHEGICSLHRHKGGEDDNERAQHVRADAAEVVAPIFTGVQIRSACNKS